MLPEAHSAANDGSWASAQKLSDLWVTPSFHCLSQLIQHLCGYIPALNTFAMGNAEIFFPAWTLTIAKPPVSISPMTKLMSTYFFVLRKSLEISISPTKWTGYV